MRRISESMIRNAVRKSINEISYGKVDLARHKAYKTFNDLSTKFNDFYEELEYLESEDFANNVNMNVDDEMRYIGAIKSYADKIKVILDRKMGQIENADKELRMTDITKYEDDVENLDKDYAKEDLGYLQSKYPRTRGPRKIKVTKSNY